MKTTMKFAAILLVSSSSLACEFYARSPADYETATNDILASKSDELKSCYDAALKTDGKAAGTVTVKFTVEPKTGAIVSPTVDEAATTAPAPLPQCVLTAMEGLKLDPPDQREGQATYTYEFRANAPKQL